MIDNLNPHLLATVSRDAGTLFALVELLADRKATQARIAEIKDAASQAQQAIERAANDTKEIDRVRKEAASAMAAERQTHIDTIHRERAEHDAACARRTAELDVRENDMKTLEAKATADAAEAARLKEDMQRRIRLVTAA